MLNGRVADVRVFGLGMVCEASNSKWFGDMKRGN